VISVEINSVDVSSLIDMGSLRKDDALNNKVDSLTFSIQSYIGHVFVPVLDAEVELFIDAVKHYGGRITSFNERVESDKIVSYDITCADYSQDANRILIQERFTNETVEAIIIALVADYAPDFTTANVDCAIVVTTVTFDRITLLEALNKLSKLTNFSFYIDYNKDIHFFQRNAEPAPFILTDDTLFYIKDTLEISRDLSQLRNRVYIRGGEIEGESRTEKFNGDGTKLTFVLGNKFSTLPTVTVNSVAKTVGIDFIDQEADFDSFWNYQQKYIRFKTGTVPAAGTNNIFVTGTPLFVLIMRLDDVASVAQYGIYEFATEDPTIKSRDEAKKFGIAQLDAYSKSIVEGSFRTYTPGLRSGQLLTIKSVWRGWEENFLIQKVTLTMVTNEVYIYTVQLATLRTMGIIDFLINLMLSGNETVADGESEVLQKVFFKAEMLGLQETVVTSKLHNPLTENLGIDDVVTSNIDFGTVFVLGPYVITGPADTKRTFILNGSLLG